MVNLFFPPSNWTLVKKFNIFIVKYFIFMRQVSYEFHFGRMMVEIFVVNL